MMTFLCLIGLLSAPPTDVTFEVRQVTTDLVYLAVAGDVVPVVGDTLVIRRGDTDRITLEVVSVSSRYISARITAGEPEVAVGDVALFRAPHQPDQPSVADTAAEAATPATPVAPPVNRPVREARARTRSGLRGSIAAQYHQYAAADDGRDYRRPTLRINLRADDLADGRVGFRLRTRSRYLSDANPAGPVRESEWNNRVYNAYVRLGREEGRFRLHLGRLISNKISGVGYLDGAMGEARVGRRGTVGLFAGSQPDWQRPDGSETLNKYGAFYHFQHRGENRYLQSTVALAGEYIGGEVNREYLYLANRYTGGKFSFFQNAEVDFNRDWRGDREGASGIALTNLYLLGSYRVSPRLSYSLGYDNRTSPYTWDLRNRDEAYFDNLSRQGYRASVNARVGEDWRVNAGAGLRTRHGEDDTTNWFVGGYHPDLFGRRFTLRLRINGFSNPYTDGTNPSLQVGWRDRLGRTLQVGWSRYAYTYTLSDEDRANDYLRLEGYLPIGRRLFAGLQFEHATGDDGIGDRIYIDFGVRF